MDESQPLGPENGRKASPAGSWESAARARSCDRRGSRLGVERHSKLHADVAGVEGADDNLTAVGDV